MAFRDHVSNITTHADTVSVIHEMMDASLAANQSPILFDSIQESPGHRATMNILSRETLCAHWGIKPGELIDIMAEAMSNPMDPESIDATDAACFEVDAPLDLRLLPIPWHHQQDAGRYMSASIVIAERAGQRNASYHRQLIVDSTTLVARMVPRHLRSMTDEARNDGEAMEVAIVNGADPTVLLAAAMSFDNRLDELTVAAALHHRIHGSPLLVTRASNGVMVPANSEYVMTATITGEDAPEGPYVDITGTVDDVRDQPVISVQSIHHRQDPIFHAILPAGSEHKTLMGLPRAPTIKQAVDAVCDCHDVHLSDGGCGWLSSVIQITPSSADSAMDAITAALAGHRSMKQVTVVDRDIAVDDPEKVEWAMMTRWQPDRDTVILRDQKGSSLDPSRSAEGTTAKVGFDATIPHGVDPTPYRAVF